MIHDTPGAVPACLVSEHRHLRSFAETGDSRIFPGNTLAETFDVIESLAQQIKREGGGTLPVQVNLIGRAGSRQTRPAPG